jgi:hypothetical protein
MNPEMPGIDDGAHGGPVLETLSESVARRIF